MGKAGWKLALSWKECCGLRCGEQGWIFWLVESGLAGDTTFGNGSGELKVPPL